MIPWKKRQESIVDKLKKVVESPELKYLDSRILIKEKKGEPSLFGSYDYQQLFLTRDGLQEVSGHYDATAGCCEASPPIYGTENSSKYIKPAGFQKIVKEYSLSADDFSRRSGFNI